MGKSIPDRRDNLEEKVILTLPDKTEYLFNNPNVNPPIEFTQRLIERNGVSQSGGYKRKYTRKQRRHKLRGAYL